MASIERRGKSYRVIFRYNGQRFTRSLQTKCERVATAAMHRLEDNLRRVQLGTLRVPDTVDPPQFLLCDGQVACIAKAETKPAARWTIAKLCDHYMMSLPDGAIEATTRMCLEIHIHHFKRIFGTRLATADWDSAALQDYVNQRSRAVGRRGKPLNARTIQKEIATLNCIWTRALVQK